ncbi:hypothetical protein IAR50_006617 [Cryptococcus sp. DSM 104548]
MLSPSPPIHLTLSIGSLIGSGRLSDVYSIKSISQPDPLPPLVVKIMCPSTFDDAEGLAGYEPGSKALEAWEWRQSYVPGRILAYKVMSCPGALALLGARFITEKEVRSLPLETKLTVRTAYEGLHSARVIHNDVEFRYVLRPRRRKSLPDRFRRRQARSPRRIW